MKAEKVIINAKVRSYGLGEDKKEYEAVAVLDGKIAAAGSNEEITAMASDDTEVIDAAGASVVSGFTDSHLHVSSVAEMLFSIPIYYIEPEEGDTRDSYIDRVVAEPKKFAEENPDAPIIRATGWNPAAFSAMGGQPTAKELDRVCADRPVLLRSYCHHFLWANTKALEMSGITKDTPLGQGCIVEKDEEGNPTGTFVDVPATEMVLDSFDIADFSVEEYKAGILHFQENNAKPNGITAVYDAFLRPHAIEAYRQLAQEGLLTMRVRGAFLADPTKPVSQFDKMIEEKGKYDTGDMFRIDTIKFFFDGGDDTGLYNEPLNAEYLTMLGHPADYTGPYIWYPDQAKEAFEKLCKAGYQIHIHVMGDAAAKEALDTFEYVDSLGIKGLRHTLTHVMLIDEEDMERMAKLGVVASMQAQWAIYDDFTENYVMNSLGKERALRAYPVGEMARRNVIISAATDYPIDPMYNTFGNIQIGMTRSVPKDHPAYEKYKGIPLGPDDDKTKYCVSMDQMMTAYTAGGAYQLFMEDYAGKIEPGMSAELVILDKDMEAIPVDDIVDVKVKNLIFKGNTVYSV